MISCKKITIKSAQSTMKKCILLFVAMLLLVGCGAPKDDVLSINGIYLGKKVPADQDHMIMDDNCSYMENNVGYNVDSNDRVEYMVFYRVENTAGEELYGLSNIKLFYHGEHLNTTEKVIACFGKDYVPVKDEPYETFTFEDDELIVEISLYNGEFNGIIVKPR